MWGLLTDWWPWLAGAGGLAAVARTARGAYRGTVGLANAAWERDKCLLREKALDAEVAKLRADIARLGGSASSASPTSATTPTTTTS